MPSSSRFSRGCDCLTLGIIGLLIAGVMLPRFLTQESPRRNPTRSWISSFKTSLQIYAQDNGRYPTTAQGLQALIEKPVRPPIPPHWRRYMDIPSLPADAWGRPFIYECPGLHGAPFLILSLGRDGRRGSEDDIDSR